MSTDSNVWIAENPEMGESEEALFSLYLPDVYDNVDQRQASFLEALMC